MTTPAEQQQQEQQHGDDDPGELLELIPLGAGSEVGRSCVVASFFGGKKNVTFDCGFIPDFPVKFVAVLRRNRSERDRRAVGDAFPPGPLRGGSVFGEQDEFQRTGVHTRHEAIFTCDERFRATVETDGRRVAAVGCERFKRPWTDRSDRLSSRN